MISSLLVNEISIQLFVKVQLKLKYIDIDLKGVSAKWLSLSLSHYIAELAKIPRINRQNHCLTYWPGEPASDMITSLTSTGRVINTLGSGNKNVLS